VNQLVAASYSPMLVALSYLVSAVGAFLAMKSIAQYRASITGFDRWVNLCAASVALGGFGIWTMHFLGMLALQLPLAVAYSLPETLGSLVAAVLACGIALWALAQKRSPLRYAVAGLCLGAAICVMHYLGMQGMRFGGRFVWSWPTVGASVAVAVVAATLGLVLGFQTQRLAGRILGALVMGAAVCAMHYTGMAAADFVCTTTSPTLVPPGQFQVRATDMPGLIAIIALSVFALVAVDRVFTRMSRNMLAGRA